MVIDMMQQHPSGFGLDRSPVLREIRLERRSVASPGPADPYRRTFSGPMRPAPSKSRLEHDRAESPLDAFETRAACAS
jgi:hypothetical protein